MDQLHKNPSRGPMKLNRILLDYYKHKDGYDNTGHYSDLKLDISASKVPAQNLENSASSAELFSLEQV